MLAPLLTSAVQSCHTGSVSLPLLVTLTLYSASAGMLPVTASRATVMSPSTAMGVSRVMVAAWTALVKVAVKAAVSVPSFTSMEIGRASGREREQVGEGEGGVRRKK